MKKPVITEIAIAANKYLSNIALETQSGLFDAKSILGVYSTFINGKPNNILISGPDSKEARDELQTIVNKHQLTIEVKELD